MSVDQCYCAFCRSPRKLNTKKHIRGFDVAKTGVLAAATGWLVWGELDPRGFVLWGLWLGAWELFTQVSWRLDLVCKVCDFDPLLYLRDQERASQRVKKRLDDLRRGRLAGLRASPPVVGIVHDKNRSPRKRALNKFIGSPSQRSIVPHPQRSIARDSQRPTAPDPQRSIVRDVTSG